MAVTYSGVEKAYKKKNAAIDQKVAADGRAYDAQRQDITDGATDTLQQIYLQKERSAALQRQQNRAAGITGGAAESSRIALEANYNTNRTNTMIERDKQLSDVNIAESQAKAQSEIDKSTNKVELETGRLAFKQDREQQAFQNEQFDFDKQKQRTSELWEMIRAGVVTRSMAKELGWKYETLKAVANQYKEGN